MQLPRTKGTGIPLGSDPVPMNQPQGTDSIDALLRSVVDGGFCIGCGVCASVRPDRLRMQMDRYGRYQPSEVTNSPIPVYENGSSVQTGSRTWDQSQLDEVSAVCPFGSAAMDEDQIAVKVFGDEMPLSPEIGRHLAVIAGHVKEGSFRNSGSSGGFASWLLSELLSSGMVDAVVHVTSSMSREEDVLFRYNVSRSTDAVRLGSKSRYYPVELSHVLELKRRVPGRYAVVGLPCFIKALRLLSFRDHVIRDRITYYIGLVCGHLKTARYADLLAWQCGIPPGQLEGIDFRCKLDSTPANDYAVHVWGYNARRERVSVQRPMRELVGRDWGQGLLKYSACDYCDDVFGETADISIGDAWLPRYVTDPRGTNIAVIRNRDILELFTRAKRKERVAYDILAADEAALSQAAGLRHRREGLSYRLRLLEEEGRWHPPKRIRPGQDRVNRRRRKIYEVRLHIAKRGPEAFEQAIDRGSLQFFLDEMRPLLMAYERTYRPSWRRAAGMVWRLLRSARGKVER